MPDFKNTLYYGDNLAILREHVADEVNKINTCA